MTAFTQAQITNLMEPSAIPCPEGNTSTHMPWGVLSELALSQQRKPAPRFIDRETFLSKYSEVSPTRPSPQITLEHEDTSDPQALAVWPFFSVSSQFYLPLLRLITSSYPTVAKHTHHPRAWELQWELPSCMLQWARHCTQGFSLLCIYSSEPQ